jgi:hypothetical protein
VAPGWSLVRVHVRHRSRRPGPMASARVRRFDPHVTLSERSESNGSPPRSDGPCHGATVVSSGWGSDRLSVSRQQAAPGFDTVTETGHGHRPRGRSRTEPFLNTRYPEASCLCAPARSRRDGIHHSRPFGGCGFRCSRWDKPIPYSVFLFLEGLKPLPMVQWASCPLWCRHSETIVHARAGSPRHHCSPWCSGHPAHCAVFAPKARS